MHFDVASLEFAFAATAAAFILVSVAVWRGLCDPLDAAIMKRIPIAAIDRKPTRFYTVMRDLSSLGSDTVRTILLIACTGGLLIDGNPVTALSLVAITLGARLFVVALKTIIKRERPPVAGDAVPTYTTSFPSGHTLMAAVMLVSAAALLTEGAAWAVQAYALVFACALSLWIGLARVYLRVHWPSDVLAGWLAGGAWVSGLLLFAT